MPMGERVPNQEDPSMVNQINMQDQDLNTENSHEYKFKFSVYEYLMCGFVVLFLMNWLYGKSQNESLAMKWFNANKSFFAYNYAHIGYEKNYSQFNMNNPFL
jgi:hypothetical protein